MTDPAVTVFASFSAKPGRRTELLELLTWMVGHTRSEPGCERYDLYAAKDSDERFHLFERYRSEQALAEHRAAEHYVEYRRRVVELIEGSVDVVLLEAVDVSG